MSDLPLRVRLLLSLQRALWGAVYPQLRQTSIEADEHAHLIRVRFEYDGKPTDEVLDACQIAATEVIADFAGPWTIDDQHCEVPFPLKLNRLEHLAYLRAEECV
jgi:hypothetical protein